jgi:hypothetical protein
MSGDLGQPRFDATQEESGRYIPLYKILRLHGQMSSVRVRLWSSLAKLEVPDDDCHQGQNGGDDAEDNCSGRVGVGLGQCRGHGRVRGRVRLDG